MLNSNFICMISVWADGLFMSMWIVTSLRSMHAQLKLWIGLFITYKIYVMNRDKNSWSNPKQVPHLMYQCPYFSTALFSIFMSDIWWKFPYLARLLTTLLQNGTIVTFPPSVLVKKMIMYLSICALTRTDTQKEVHRHWLLYCTLFIPIYHFFSHTLTRIWMKLKGVAPILYWQGNLVPIHSYRTRHVLCINMRS